MNSNVDNFSVNKTEATEIFTIYNRSGGKLPKKHFPDVLQKFFDFTFDAYISGTGSRSEALENFEIWLVSEHGHNFGGSCVIGRDAEVHSIFRAVDNWSAYT